MEDGQLRVTASRLILESQVDALRLDVGLLRQHADVFEWLNPILTPRSPCEMTFH